MWAAVPDVVLVGGKIVTLDGTSRVCSAVAVRGDAVLGVGSEADMRALADPAATIIELDGRTVIPGLIDAHAHIDREGLRAALPSLAGARSVAEVVERIRELARERGPGEWIVTMPIGAPPRYADLPDQLAEGRFPDRHDLDRAAPRNPVYIRPIWGFWRHAPHPDRLVSIANSAALERLGIGRDTPDPGEGLVIERDADGMPTGRFFEDTTMPVLELTLLGGVPGFRPEDRVAGLEAGMAAYAACGTTGVFEGHGVCGEVQAAWRRLWQEGRMRVRGRLVHSPAWEAVRPEARRRMVWEWAGLFGGRGFGDDWLRVGGLYAEMPVKQHDHLRATAAPYTGWAGFNYDCGLPRDALRDILIEAARADLRGISLTIGMLDLYAEVDKVAPLGGKRWVIQHVGVLTPEQIRRIADLGLVVSPLSVRYIHKEGLASPHHAGLPPAHFMPMRALRDAGIRCGLATDNATPSLFGPIWHVVGRIDGLGRRSGPDEQRLSREEALRAATLDGAYLTFDEDRRGSLEPGKLADLAVLSADPLTCAEPELPSIRSDLTMVGGRIVHAGGGLARRRGSPGDDDGCSDEITTARGT